MGGVQEHARKSNKHRLYSQIKETGPISKIKLHVYNLLTAVLAKWILGPVFTTSDRQNLYTEMQASFIFFSLRFGR